MHCGDPSFYNWFNETWPSVNTGWCKQRYFEALNKWQLWIFIMTKVWREWRLFSWNPSWETSVGVAGAEKGWCVWGCWEGLLFGAQWQSQSVPLLAAQMGIRFPRCRWSGLHIGSWAFTLILELNVTFIDQRRRDLLARWDSQWTRLHWTKRFRKQTFPSFDRNYLCLAQWK